MVRPALPLALCLALVAVAGCDKVVEALNEGAQAAAEAADGGGAATEDDKLGAKLDPYIDCINSHSRRVHDAADRYLDWVDAKEGPTGKESNVYGTYEVSDPATCVNGIKQSADAEPDDPELEAAAQAFGDALAEATTVINEAHKYYDEKNYKDDAFAKGKELHPKLMAAFEKFDAADTALRDRVGSTNDALQARELARIEKEMGKNLLWYNKKIMVSAKQLMQAGDVKIEPFELDLAKFEPLLKDFESILEEAQTYAKGHKEELDSVTMYSSFLDDAEDLKKTAKELLRRKRDNTGFDKGEMDYFARGMGEHVEGSPAKLGNQYNDLVSSSNRLSWNFYKPAGSGA